MRSATLGTPAGPAEPRAGRLAFDLPPHLEAHEPPPDGLSPAATRMLVAHREDGATHQRTLADLPDVLEHGDLVVVNDSATLPAAVDTHPGLRLHVSGALPDGTVLVEAREPDGPSSLPSSEDLRGRRLDLPGEAHVEIRYRWQGGRLWVAELHVDNGLAEYLHEHGQPIRYGTGTIPWPLEAAQTPFAREPGSAEPPSAALAFDRPLVSRLRASGLALETITLHTGVASLEEGEPPYPEWFRVPARTVRAVEDTRAAEGRVVAVGTTVTRALESARDNTGSLVPMEGWTDLLIEPGRGVHVIDGLLTGWHEPRASHLDLLEAVAQRDLLAASYARALSAGYRWHTFGDLHLVLP